jgi:hypothetical protein
MTTLNAIVARQLRISVEEWIKRSNRRREEGGIFSMFKNYIKQSKKSFEGRWLQRRMGNRSCKERLSNYKTTLKL